MDNITQQLKASIVSQLDQCETPEELITTLEELVEVINNPVTEGSEAFFC